MATNSAINSNVPIRIAKGGTNATTFTTDGTVYFDGTKLNSTSVGSTGNFLTSQGAAKAPVYTPLTAGFVLLQQQTASSSASIKFTSTYITTTYSSYFVTITGCFAATIGVINMNWSVNNGSGYLSSGFQSGAGSHAWNSAGWSEANSTTACPLNNGSISSSGTPFDCHIFLFNLATAFPPYSIGKWWKSGATIGNNWGTNTTTSGVNNIEFIMASGNIASGVFTLYGIK